MKKTRGGKEFVVVRGHHVQQLEILQLAQLRANGEISDLEIAQSRAEKITRNAQVYITAIGNPWIKHYGKDLIGPMGENAETFQAILTQGFLGFLSMLDSGRIEFMIKPDWICAACTSQHHCLNPNEADNDITDIILLARKCDKHDLPIKVLQQQRRKSGYYVGQTVPVRARMEKGSFIELVKKQNPLYKY